MNILESCLLNNKNNALVLYDKALDYDRENFNQFKRQAMRILELNGEEKGPAEKGPKA